MVNTAKFSKRLYKILEYYDLSAASFADKMNIGRSSISHILSGRNKPSLDFVMKVVSTYPEVEIYWLLNGKGKAPFPPKGEVADNNQVPEDKNILPFPKDTVSTIKKIKKIVWFYEDGTFEVYEP